SNKCFEGFVPYGVGFLFCPDTAGAHSLELFEKLKMEGRIGTDIVRPFIGGEELNDEPTHQHKRYVIYFGKDSLDEARRRSNTLVELLDATVRPERESKSARVALAPWWQFLWPRPKLFSALRKSEMYLALSKVSKHHAVTRISSKIMPSN